MERILLAINSENPNPHALDFACYLANLCTSTLTGVFLDDPLVEEVLERPENYSSRRFHEETGGQIESLPGKHEKRQESIERFKKACERRSVRQIVHTGTGDPVHDLVSESRFADLLVLDASMTFDPSAYDMPSHFSKSVLKDAECPVIIAPESFDSIDEIVFTYDGSKSSVFAIKQFCHLFPEFDDKKITVLHIDEQGDPAGNDNENFREWISNHYSFIGYETVKGDAETELFAHLLKKKNVFIVMGAYGRSALSRLFNRSHADLLLKTLTQAIFIAHI